MYYLDTSILAAYYCPELLSEKVEKIIISAKRPCMSSLTEVELASAISRKIRQKNLLNISVLMSLTFQIT